MFSHSKLLFLIVTNILFTYGDPIVELPNGKVLGYSAVTFENHTYYSFEGIPFAAPPVGPLRFKAPQPAQNWDGILNGTYRDVACPQSNADNESEDCLYINIYTPKLPGDDNASNTSLPVIFHIYGGGFQVGSYQWYHPDMFINSDVIMVNFNYRVGMLGFLSTKDDVIPGNFGLKDQQFAIKWASDNIHLFGGDPNKITIIGESAGSASLAYQLLNQNNNGLFQGAILQSGSCLSPWAFQRNPRKIAFETASYLNSTFENSDDSQLLLEFLQNADAKDLVAASLEYVNNETLASLQVYQGFFWAPVVEAKNPEAFITKNMYGLLEAGNVVAVPIFIGTTSEESLFFNQDPEVLKSNMEAYDEHLDWLVPNDMRIENETERIEMGRAIRQIYTGGEPLADHLGAGVRISSDHGFTKPVIKTAEFFSKVSKTYYYQFSYDGERANFNVHYDGAESVGHGEDSAYIYCSGSGCDDSDYPESDHITRQRLLKLIINFATYLDPTPEPIELLQNITWPSVSVDDGNFYYLDFNEDLTIKNHPKQETYEGWGQLYDGLEFTDFDTY